MRVCDGTRAMGRASWARYGGGGAAVEGRGQTRKHARRCLPARINIRPRRRPVETLRRATLSSRVESSRLESSRVEPRKPPWRVHSRSVTSASHCVTVSWETQICNWAYHVAVTGGVDLRPDSERAGRNAPTVQERYAYLLASARHGRLPFRDGSAIFR